MSGRPLAFRVPAARAEMHRLPMAPIEPRSQRDRVMLAAGAFIAGCVMAAGIGCWVARACGWVRP